MYKRAKPIERVIIINPKRKRKKIDALRAIKTEKYWARMAELRNEKETEEKKKKEEILEKTKFKNNVPAVDQLWNYLGIK